MDCQPTSLVGHVYTHLTDALIPSEFPERRTALEGDGEKETEHASHDKRGGPVVGLRKGSGYLQEELNALE